MYFFSQCQRHIRKKKMKIRVLPTGVEITSSDATIELFRRLVEYILEYLMVYSALVVITSSLPKTSPNEYFHNNYYSII